VILNSISQTFVEPTMPDIKQPWLLYFKAAMFLLCGMLCSGLLLLQSPSLRTVVLLCVMAWSFCRSYYFTFYVVQRYVDDRYRFAGLWNFARYCWRGNGR